MRRFIRMVLGFISAMLAAGATQVMFAQPPTEFATLNDAARLDLLTEMGALMLRAATHTAIFCAVFAPMVILIGELQRLRSASYYVLTGILISLGGFLAEYTSENAAQPTIVNGYALTAFIVTGAIGGLAYWMVSGRNAGRRRPAARIRVAGGPDAGVWEEVDENQNRPDVKTVGAPERKNGPRDGEANAVNVDAKQPDGKRPNGPKTSVPASGPKVVTQPSPATLASTVPDSGGTKSNKG